MAWYALYKWFRTFRKSPYVNYVDRHRKYLYDQWFNGLSLEEQADEICRVEREKAARRRRSQQALNIMYAMSLYAKGRVPDFWK